MSFESTCTVNCLYWTDDTQAYIRMDCKRGNSVSALGVGGNGLWTKTIVANTLKWPFRPCVSGDLHKKKNLKKYAGCIS